MGVLYDLVRILSHSCSPFLVVSVKQIVPGKL